MGITPREQIEPWKDFFCAALTGLVAQSGPIAAVELAKGYADAAQVHYNKRLQETEEAIIKMEDEIRADMQKRFGKRF